MKRKRSISQNSPQNFQVSEEHDDGFLPDIKTIEEFTKLTPDAPQFFIETAKREQEFRHELTRKGMKLSSREQLLSHGLNYFGLACALLIGVGAMAFSYFLIMENKDMLGTIFAGGTLIAMAALFIRAVSGRNQPPKNQK